MSIGEPENSQDTPLRSTTPMRKRGRNPETRLGSAKKAKKQSTNQCQSLFRIICTSRAMEDKFDPNFDAADEVFDDMDKLLDDGRANIQATKEDEHGLLQVIQALEKKYKAAKKSSDTLGVETTGLAAMPGSQNPNPADIEMPDYDPRQDDVIVRQCYRTHNKRTEGIKNALEEIGMVRRRVHEFKGELRQVQGNYSEQVKRVRLEYEARLSQQRKELKSSWNKDLKSQTTAELSSKLVDANAGITELSSKLADAELANKNAASLLLTREKSLEVMDKRLSEWKPCATRVSTERDQLRTSLKVAEAESASYTTDVYIRLNQTSQRLHDTRRSLIEYKACTIDKAKQLDLARSDYATLLIDVALVQKRKLDVARSQKTLLNGYLARNRSTTTHLESINHSLSNKLKAKAIQMESQVERLAQVDKLLKIKTGVVDHLENRLTKEQKIVDQKKKTIAANRAEIRNVNRMNQELEAAINLNNDLLTENAMDISEKALEIQILTDQVSEAAEDLAAQRSIVARRDEEICEFENAGNALKARIEHIHSNLGLKQMELDRNVSTMTSQDACIRELESANKGLLQEQAETGLGMTKLKADISKLRLDLDEKKVELRSQAALLIRKDATIRDRDITNAGLSQEKAKMISDMDVLKTQLSMLALDLGTQKQDFQLQASATASNKETIQMLQRDNAVLLQAKYKTDNENTGLQDALAQANGSIRILEADLDASGRKLGRADEQIEQLCATVEKARIDLLAEKSANQTVSLEKRLAITDHKLETLSTDLSEEREKLGQEISRNASLVSGMHSGRTFPGVLGGEKVSVQAFTFCWGRKALIIVEKGRLGRNVWHESLDKCLIEVVGWDWCLRLKKGSNEGSDGLMEVWVKFSDAPDLGEWLKGSDSGNENGLTERK